MSGPVDPAPWPEAELLTRALRHGLAYRAGLADRAVAPGEQALEGLGALEGPIPDGPQDPALILDRLHTVGSPATVAQDGGRFFGLVNGGVLPVGLAARILADIWDQNAVLHAVSPVSAVIEETCERWLRDLFGLPQPTVAGFVSGSSSAILCGLAAARWRLCRTAGYDVNARGLAGAPPLRIVAGAQIHSTVVKAVALLGFGTDRIESVAVDDQGRLLVEAMPELDDRTIVILQAGNVHSGAVDPLRTVGERAQRAGAWVHIDGAFGLWAAACASLAQLTDGLELAHSWSVDGHKTINSPYDNGIVLCADPEALVGAMTNSGPYIGYSDYRDGSRFTPEMSRRSRAVELWAILAALGREGVDALVLQLHQRARQFARELASAGVSVVNDVVFNQVVVEVGDEARTDEVVARIQASGEAWVGASRWFDRPVIRISVCSWRTSSDDVTRSVAAFVDALD